MHTSLQGSNCSRLSFQTFGNEPMLQATHAKAVVSIPVSNLAKSAMRINPRRNKQGSKRRRDRSQSLKTGSCKAQSSNNNAFARSRS